MIYEKLNREIEKLQKEIIKTIQECIQIESVKGSEEKRRTIWKRTERGVRICFAFGENIRIKNKKCG